MIRALVAGLAAAVLTVGASLLGALERAELAALDRLFVLRGERVPAARVVIVAIDEDSFDELNQPWPFRRALHGRLLDALAVGRPLAIGLDIFFPEPSPYGPEDDAALGAAVARTPNVALAAAITVVAEPGYVKLDLNLPIPVIRRGAAAVAPVNERHDPDGHIRRAVLRYRYGEETLPSWDVELYRLATSAGLSAAPLPRLPEVLVNFRGGPRTFPWVPYHRVVNGEVPPETFQGAIVLVGATTTVLQDVHSTPFAAAGEMPGVEFHANTLDTLVRGDYVREVPAWASVGFAVVAALAGALLAARLRALGGFGAALLGWAGLIVVTAVAFAIFQTWFQAVTPTLGLALGYGLTVIDNYVREQRERRRLGQFFSPAVLREVVRQRDDAALATSRRIITVLFADIRGFTSLSERAPAEQIAELLGEHLTEMTEIVFRHRGTVDKYMGDGMMALYNAPLDDPDHALHAVLTALELQERSLAISARWEARLGGAIRVGVGVHTGEAVVGTMGSRQRLEYTAIGDTVNIASRLEGLTKEHGVAIIVSEATWAVVHDRVVTRELGAVAVRGRAHPVKIYAVLPMDVRAYPRAALAAAGIVTAASAGAVATVRTLDVSVGGVAVTGLPSTWSVGMAVEIRCEGGDLPRPLAAAGTIVWRRDDAAGIAFAGPAAAAAAALPGGSLPRPGPG